MTYYVTALTSDKSRMFVKTLQTSDQMTAECVADIWEQEGFIVVRRQEG